MNWQLILHWFLSFLIPALIVELIRRELNQKGAKLVYYSSEVISHRIVRAPTPNAESTTPALAQTFWLNSLVINIQNNGNVAAHQVEICHPQAPEHFQLTPSLEYQEIRVSDSRRLIIKIPTIAPKERVSISYLFGTIQSWNDLLEYIRSEDGLAERISVNTLRAYPMWFNYMVLGFCFLGLIFLGVIIWWLFPPFLFLITWLINFPRQ